MTVNEANLYLPKLGIIEYEALSVNIDNEHNRYAGSDLNCQIENPNTGKLWLTLIYVNQTTLIQHNTDLKMDEKSKKKKT